MKSETNMSFASQQGREAMKPETTLYRKPTGVGKIAASAVLSLAIGAFASSANADDGKPVKGGTVIAALNSTTIPTLNTQLTSSVPALFAADVWADGLITYDKTGKRLPRLATKWE